MNFMSDAFAPLRLWFFIFLSFVLARKSDSFHVDDLMIKLLLLKDF